MAWFQLSFRHIVFCDTDIGRPKYLRVAGADFDVSSICGGGGSKTKGSKTKGAKRLLSSLNEEDLKMDETQFRAISLALKKELAVIQGPPGLFTIAFSIAC